MERKDSIEIKRHNEVLGAMGKVATAINNANEKSDKRISAIIDKQHLDIEQFIKAIPKPQPPEVKVEINNAEIVTSLDTWGDKIMEGFKEVVYELKNRPLATKLKAERNRFGDIDYVVIEYQNEKNAKR